MATSKRNSVACRRTFPLACPNCRHAGTESYAWCAKRVFELVCGRCSYYYDADTHGPDLRNGQVVTADTIVGA